MLKYVVRRLAWSIPTLCFVTFLVYVALRIGTNPVESYKRINPRASPEKIAQYIDVNGLDPNYVRGYFRWLVNFITLDWPRSIKGSREVAPALKDALANTLRLGTAASVVGITVGLLLGIFAALRPGGRRDVAVNTAAFVGISIPPYVSAILFQLFFAVYWSRWFGSTLFPTSGVYPPGQTGFNLGLMIRHMVLPTMVVAIQIIAVYARYMRSSLLDVLSSEYMRTARSKGISERRVLFKHGLRNALIPVVTIAALDVGSIVGGLIITENIFSYPGMGKYFLSAFGEGDFPLLMPWMVLIVFSVLLFNLLADVSYAWLDPRIRLE
ncbi:MAG: ABC transporter permease [Acidimicrobiaceae bacterium]|nr:ABC transporter permease [Ilumatobacteraceae bacterium]NQW67749.1 ABC transporter permease [Acidimicrobiaceae bacterium]